MSKLQIKVKGFDHALVDDAAKKVYEIAKDVKAKVSGPVPLPTKREEITILRSVHVNKKSREQFESRTHQRLLVVEANEQFKDKLDRLELPHGVAVQVKISK